MEDILKKVDTSVYDIYTIEIKVKECFLFVGNKEGEASHNEHGESLDSVSLVRRAIKQSVPLDNKKIIKFINIEDNLEDENQNIYRNIHLHYYLLAEKDEEEFPVEELHDDLEEEWKDESAKCEVQIKLYEE